MMMDTERATFKLKNQLSEISRVAAGLDSICNCMHHSKETRFQLRLLLEELLVNIISHAFPRGGEHTISLEIVGETGKVTIYCVDDGIAFDLSRRKDPDLTLPPDQRPVGGLGVLLIKQTADEITYRRKNKHNHTKIVKYVSSLC